MGIIHKLKADSDSDFDFILAALRLSRLFVLDGKYKEYKKYK